MNDRDASISLAMIVLGICRRRLPLVLCGAAGCLMLVGSVLLLLPWVNATNGGPGNECKRHIRQIGLAIINYESANKCYPPAYIADENGRPMHSWRVLILPYLEEQELFDQYRFDEPWDGPNNRKLAEKMPQVFRCYAENPAVPQTMTNYVAVVGPGTAWPGEKSRKVKDFGDGTSKTIFVVEVANSGIHWMEPRDLQMTQMNPKINAKSGQGISSNHPQVAFVLFVDGHVQVLSDEVEPKILQALLTVDGGEVVDTDDL